MHVNNETGVIQDIATIGELCRSRDVLFHVDAAQSVGKVPIDLDNADRPVVDHGCDLWTERHWRTVRSGPPRLPRRTADFGGGQHDRSGRGRCRCHLSSLWDRAEVQLRMEDDRDISSRCASGSGRQLPMSTGSL